MEEMLTFSFSFQVHGDVMREHAVHLALKCQPIATLGNNEKVTKRNDK